MLTTALKHRVIHAGLASFGRTGLHRLVAPLTRGLGAILTFHHVRPWIAREFAPNRMLEITPDFLDALLTHVKARGYRVVPLDEVVPLLQSGGGGRPFVALTFDDGYRDNLVHALPILERHDAPFAEFVTTGFADRTARLWWVELEAVIRKADRIDIALDGVPAVLVTHSAQQKNAAYRILYEALLRLPEPVLLATVRDLCTRHDVSGMDLVETFCMDWSEIGRLAAHPLASIGCHTLTHPRLAVCEDVVARSELTEARAILETRLHRPVRHVAYPIGQRDAAGPREYAMARDLGFTAAVTTRPGVLFAEHGDHATALPRISINGNWQDVRAIDVLLSGAAFALWNRGRRINVD